MKIFSQGIKKIPYLSQFLKDCPDDAVLGWGNKPNTLKARRYAEKNSLPYTALEDGFIRSMGLGVRGNAPLSLIADDLGIYYDYHQPSRLERTILEADLSALLPESQRAIDLIIANKLSKYNHVADDLPADLPFAAHSHHVLVIDQTAGDMSLLYGGATADSFAQMLEAAIAENPQSVIWVKIHPDVLNGKKQGHFADYLNDPRIRLIAQDVNPIALLAQMDAVYVMTSQMGFEALLLGKQVITFGVPWYAGWGLTNDRHADVATLRSSRRRRDASLLELFAAAYLRYCRYLNPFTHAKGSIFDVIDYLILRKRHEALLSGVICCIGLSWWKRNILAPFIRSPSNQIRHFSTLSALKKQDDYSNVKLLLWSNKHTAAQDWAKAQHIPIIRMEDGFIRSVGLGSNLVPPLSLVFDDKGIYFDANQPSRLEYLLENYQFTQAEQDKAAAFMLELINKKIDKYNVGSSAGFAIHNPEKRDVILVVGQVEDDASIQSASFHIKRNLDLIKAVRKRNPAAYLIYKPHPDVMSGNRRGAVDEKVALQFVDHVEESSNIIDVIARADELHTMTSLSGFEALLRGKKVTCYGAPFYSGWGLTTDYQAVPRRKRQLALPELVYAVMFLYPTYIDPDTQGIIDPFAALSILERQRKAQPQMISANYLVRKKNQLKALMHVFYTALKNR